MYRSKTIGILAGAAAILGLAIGGPGAIAAVSSSDAKIVVPAGTDSIVFGTPVDIAAGSNGIATVTCGTKVTGGGGTTSAFDILFTDSYPSATKTWTVRGRNYGTTTQQLTAWAVCR